MLSKIHKTANTNSLYDFQGYMVKLLANSS